jgi:hypothetical protein
MRGAIQAKSNITNFQSADYWSSSKNDTTLTWARAVIDGVEVDGQKSAFTAARPSRNAL